MSLAFRQRAKYIAAPVPRPIDGWMDRLLRVVRGFSRETSLSFGRGAMGEVDGAGLLKRYFVDWIAFRERAREEGQTLLM